MATRGLWWAETPNLKYETLKISGIFGMSSPVEQTQIPSVENFLATVLGNIAMVSEDTTNNCFLSPCRTCQRHLETSAANFLDFEQCCLGLVETPTQRLTIMNYVTK